MIDNINGGFGDGCAPVSVSCRKENLLEPTSSELICGRVVAIALVVLGSLLAIAGSVLLAVGAVSCWLPPVIPIIIYGRASFGGWGRKSVFSEIS